ELQAEHRTDAFAADGEREPDDGAREPGGQRPALTHAVTTPAHERALTHDVVRQRVQDAGYRLGALAEPLALAEAAGDGQRPVRTAGDHDHALVTEPVDDAFGELRRERLERRR